MGEVLDWVVEEKQMIQLTFYMEPVAQARARTTMKDGKAWAYTPDKTAAAKDFIKAHTISWANKKGVREFPIFERSLPLHMTATFVRSRPKSISKRITVPAGRPDLDRFANLVLDSLTGIIYADDAQVVGILLEKEYVKPGGLPRIELTIWEEMLGDQPVKQSGRRHKNARK